PWRPRAGTTTATSSTDISPGKRPPIQYSVSAWFIPRRLPAARAAVAAPGAGLPRELLRRGQQHAGGDAVHRGLQLGDRRQGRGEADVAIVRVVLQREGGAGAGQRDAGLLRQLDDATGGAVHDVQGDEVAAGRAGPFR